MLTISIKLVINHLTKEYHVLFFLVKEAQPNNQRNDYSTSEDPTGESNVHLQEYKQHTLPELFRTVRILTKKAHLISLEI